MKTAVVLAGGGSRGAYQIGVWKGLHELNIDYQLVTGTSVGALNGALMVQRDFDRALEVWENLSFKDVVGDMQNYDAALSDRQLTRIFAREALANGGADISALETFVGSVLDEDKFYSSDVDFALVTVEYPQMKPLELQKKDIPKGELGEYLLASAACFPAFRAKEIDGHKYIDGGYHDNMPINLAVKMGADVVIAVDLESIGVSRRIKTDKQKVILIKSRWPLGSFLKFDKELASKNIKLGYLDTLKTFGELDGQMYAFTKDSAFFYTSPIRERTERLIREASGREPTFASLIKNSLIRRMLREFRRRTVNTASAVPFTVSRQLIMAAEFLGEFFGVDPTQEYEFGQFLRLLVNSAEEYRNRPMAQELFNSTDILAVAADIQKLNEELQRIDHAFLVLLILERIKRLLEGGGSLGELAVMTALWKEFAAAIMLLMLEEMSDEELCIK